MTTVRGSRVPADARVDRPPKQNRKREAPIGETPEWFLDDSSDAAPPHHLYGPPTPAEFAAEAARTSARPRLHAAEVKPHARPARPTRTARQG